MIRRDYAFPFRIDPASGQAMQTGYASHVDQMIRQVLLTSPGERADLPEFGCGLRRLIFAPNSDALAATTQILVQQALNKWLAGQIQVQTVSVLQSGDIGYDPAQLSIQIEYQLVENRTTQLLQLKVS
jgi:phage baseplate assembly protein W